MSNTATMVVGILTAFCCSGAMAAEPDVNHPALAKFILESVPARTGLCVHMGVQDGGLAVALSDGGRFLVHGLGTEQGGIERARKRIAAAGLPGAVSVEHGSFNPLPYADNIVSLLVVDDIPGLLKQGLKFEEVTRVLSPHGIAWLGQSSGNGGALLSSKALKEMVSRAGLQKVEIAQEQGIWAKYVKPRPTGMDVWTHQAYDPSGNPASTDQMGMPNGVRWIAGPNWPNGYRKSGTSARVVSEKHLAYIFRDKVHPDKPEKWNLYVRNAYNGLLLWKKALNTQSPTLVSAGNRFIISVDQGRWGQGGGIIAVDADTGRLVHTYEHAKGCRSVFHIDGKLVVHVPEGLRCLDAGSGKIVWSIPNNPGSEMRGFNAAKGTLFLHLRRRGRDGQTVHIFKSLDLATGRERWTNNSASWCKGGLRLLFNQYDVLVAREGGVTHGISAKDGSHLWSHQTQHGALATAGLIWAMHPRGDTGPGWDGLDPQTGKIVKRVSKWTEPEPYHWIRCCGNTATPNFIICGGFDYADFKTGEIKLFKAAKNGCTTAGVVPANGMAYTFAHACGCRNWVRGFLAYAATEVPDVAATNHADRLQKGPAYGASTTTSTQSTEEWPTYRHDTGRSAATAASGPQRLDVLWKKGVTSTVPASLANQWDLMDDGGRMTAPVAAHGLVFVVASEQHTITALDAKTGAVRWSFIAGGRIDSPPTIHAGLCLFGSRDGWIYCLTAEDGRLVWRYRAAPRESRIVAYGQLESIWPVVGGVLVHDGLAYFTAGRHSDADGGVVVGAVEPETGRLVWMQHAEGLGGVPDVLIAGNGTVSMASLSFDAKNGKLADSKARLRAGRLGLRNDAWNKNPLALRKRMNIWRVDKDESKSGQMFSFNKSVTVGFRTGVNHDDDNLARSFSGYARLFAIPEKDENAKADHLRKEWHIDMHAETRVRGMVLTPERLYVAGRLYHTLPVKNPASYDMGSGNFTLSVRFMIPTRYGYGANLVSKAPPGRLPSTGMKQIFFKANRIHYAIDGLGTLTSQSEVGYGKWHHVVVTDHNGEVRLYIDGKLEGKKEQFTKPDVKGHILKLQERRGAWMDFRGEMSEVRFYNRPLDDTAAKALSSDKDPGGAAPALLWKPAPDRPKSVEELPNVVRIYSVADGKILGEYPVEEEFVHDCLAIAGDRLYVSTEKGLICLGEK